MCLASLLLLFPLLQGTAQSRLMLHKDKPPPLKGRKDLRSFRRSTSMLLDRSLINLGQEPLRPQTAPEAPRQRKYTLQGFDPSVLELEFENNQLLCRELGMEITGNSPYWKHRHSRLSPLQSARKETTTEEPTTTSAPFRQRSMSLPNVGWGKIRSSLKDKKLTASAAAAWEPQPMLLLEKKRPFSAAVYRELRQTPGMTFSLNNNKQLEIHLDKETNIDKPVWNNNRLLNMVLDQGHRTEPIVKELLLRRADPVKPNTMGFSPLDLATLKQDFGAMEALVNADKSGAKRLISKAKRHASRDPLTRSQLSFLEFTPTPALEK